MVISSDVREGGGRERERGRGRGREGGRKKEKKRKRKKEREREREYVPVSRDLNLVYNSIGGITCLLLAHLTTDDLLL